MSVFQATVLGAVQGLTEFVPVSSSGHLVLVPDALGWNSPGLAFDVLLHVASLVALVVYFAGELWDLVRGVTSGDGEQRRLLWLLVLASLPAAVAGLAFGDFFEATFEDSEASAVQLLMTAVILVAGEQALRWHERRTAEKGERLRGIDDLRAADAGVMGVAQAVSILPGISRSGSMIGAGLGLAVARDDAARFAFLLAIPALIGAALIKIPDLGSQPLGLGAASAAFASSLVTSYAAIWGLIRYLRSRTLYPFAAYCVVAGVAFLILI